MQAVVAVSAQFNDQQQVAIAWKKWAGMVVAHRSAVEIVIRQMRRSVRCMAAKGWLRWQQLVLMERCAENGGRQAATRAREVADKTDARIMTAVRRALEQQQREHDAKVQEMVNAQVRRAVATTERDAQTTITDAIRRVEEAKNREVSLILAATNGHDEPREPRSVQTNNSRELSMSVSNRSTPRKYQWNWNEGEWKGGQWR